ncbi:MAG TPA: hypothetical protein ENF79_00975 [Nitrososphaeria archaeon]|nr:hypothetical protein [Nitrososphaeria archaeon]
METYKLSTSIKIPTGLSSKFGALPVVEVARDDKAVYEVYEVGGSSVIVGLDELYSRLKTLEHAVRDALKRSGMSGKVKVAYVRLDEIGIKAPRRRSRKISELKYRLENELGVRVELLAE